MQVFNLGYEQEMKHSGKTSEQVEFGDFFGDWKGHSEVLVKGCGL